MEYTGITLPMANHRTVKDSLRLRMRLEEAVKYIISVRPNLYFSISVGAGC